MNAHLGNLSNATALPESHSVGQSNSDDLYEQIASYVQFFCTNEISRNPTASASNMTSNVNSNHSIRRLSRIVSQRRAEQNPSHRLVLNMQRRSSSSDGREESLSKRQRTEQTLDENPSPNRLVELRSLQECRMRTFSHFSESSPGFRQKLIIAGLFHCNVGDRTICLHCKLICQQWRQDADDPSEVHRTLSPNCRYVQSYLTPEATASSGTIDGGASSAGTATSLFSDATMRPTESGAKTAPLLASTHTFLFLVLQAPPIKDHQ
jgi:hypothetical protein